MWNPFRRPAAPEPTPEPEPEPEPEVPTPTRFTLRYEHPNGQRREITMQALDIQAARELADRRLSEQFTDQHDYEFAEVAE